MKYHLFGMKPTTDNLSAAGQYEYYLATPKFLLLYTQKGQPEKSIEIKGAQLTQSAVQWLYECNLDIIQRTVRDSPDMQKKMSDFLASLETELEKEKVKLEGTPVGD